MGMREDRQSLDQLKVELGAAQIDIERLRVAMQQALHLGVGGEYTEAARVLMTALMGPAFKVPPPSTETGGAT